MSFREFEVATDDDFEQSLGIRPQQRADDPDVNSLSITTGDDQVEVRFDVPGRSVRIDWSRGGLNIVEIVREGATRLYVDSTKGQDFIVVQFETDQLVGTMRVKVLPEISISDHLLRK